MKKFQIKMLELFYTSLVWPVWKNLPRLSERLARLGIVGAPLMMIAPNLRAHREMKSENAGILRVWGAEYGQMVRPSQQDFAPYEKVG